MRAGAAEAVVEGRFVDGEEELILRRVVPAEGRSRAYVNGRLATVAELAEHGRVLVDLHGQHAHQSLLSGVDAARRARPLRRRRPGAAPRGPPAASRAIDAALAALGGDARTRAREVDLLRFQVEELDCGCGGRRRRGRAPRRRGGRCWPGCRTTGRLPQARSPPSARTGPVTRSPPRRPRSPVGHRSRRRTTGWPRCRSSSTTPSPSCATRRMTSTRTRSASPRCGSAATCSTICAASTATRWPRCIAYREETAAAPGRARGPRPAGGRAGARARRGRAGRGGGRGGRRPGPADGGARAGERGRRPT